MEYQVKFPGWMRQSDFGPCDGEMCYFFLNKLTNGIGNKEKKRQVVEYSRGTGVNTTGCTNECVIIFGKRSSYCRMCYRNQPGNLKSNEKRKNYKFQIWVAQYVRSLFVMYSETKDMTKLSIMIQHRYIIK